MTHTYDVTDNTGKVRLFIGDTDIVPITDAQFSDEEIAIFLDVAGGSVYLAAALALEAWAATLTENYQMERIGDYEYRRGQSMKKLDLAKRYRDTVGETPAMDWAEMDLMTVTETTEE